MAAPKGNKFALGNNGGRPPHFDTPKKLEEKVVEYFDNCQPEFDDENKIIELNPPSVSGLALFLGFASRSSFDDYIKRGEEFSYIIKRAKLAIECHYEEGLNYQAPTGKIFALKNMGWSDKTEHEHSGPGGGAIETKVTIEYVDTENK